jgi:16S rRNA (cytidine1402-2'-O)-methyltransferase
MPGILYVVATPIGNLEDVTLRALRVLREVALIAAEDTRRTSKLLQHYSISTPTTSLHEHNERIKTPALIARLQGGESVALVSDAGTPLVSDPGAQLVGAAHAAGIRVEPVPGPSAAMAALSASGFGADEFVFAGFPPPKSRARRQWLQRLAAESRLLVLYEAPHRIRDTLQDMADILGDRPILLARELTKRHEELVIRPISIHLTAIPAGRGEYTLVIPPVKKETSRRSELQKTDAAGQFRHLTEIDRLGRREAIRQIAVDFGIPAREVYKLLEAAKDSG